MAVDRPKWDVSQRKKIDDSLALQRSVARGEEIAGLSKSEVRSFVNAYLLGAGDPSGKRVFGSWATSLKTPAKIFYTFDLPDEPNGPESRPESKPSPFDADQRRAVCEAMWQVEQICGLRFFEGVDSRTPVRFGNWIGGLPQSYRPQGFAPEGSDQRRPEDPAGDVWINASASTDSKDLIPWGAAYTTIFHEFGHAIGLSHAFPGLDDAAPLPLNDRKYTVMAYHHQNCASFMACDIMALQYLYGG